MPILTHSMVPGECVAGECVAAELVIPSSGPSFIPGQTFTFRELPRVTTFSESPRKVSFNELGQP